MLQLNFKLIHLNRVLIFPLFSNTHCVSHIHIHTHTHQQFSLFLDRSKWKRADSIQFRIYVRQIPEIFRNADVTCDMSHVKGTLTIVMQPKKRVNEMKKGGKKEEEKIDVGKIGTCVYTLRSETVCKNDTYTMTLAVIIVVVVAFVVVVAIVDFASLVLRMTKTQHTQPSKFIDKIHKTVSIYSCFSSSSSSPCDFDILCFRYHKTKCMHTFHK